MKQLLNYAQTLVLAPTCTKIVLPVGTLVYSLTTEVWGQCMVKFSFIFSFFIPAFKSEYNIQSSDFILVCNKFQYSYYISISNTEIWNVS